jgi:hypothetical protein
MLRGDNEMALGWKWLCLELLFDVGIAMQETRVWVFRRCRETPLALAPTLVISILSILSINLRPAAIRLLWTIDSGERMSQI